MSKVSVTVRQSVTLKGKNRRINVLWCETEEGEHLIKVETKRLIDYKTRNISSVTAGFSYETFIGLGAAMELISQDPEFIKDTNRLSGQLAKNKFTCKRIKYV
jgi:hypothetical protein